MKECDFRLHRWTDEQVHHPDHKVLVVRCSRCGVGHVIESKLIPPRKIKVDFRVFSADEDPVGQVSQEVVTWSMLTYEGTVARMKADGLDVIRGTPQIGGHY